MDLQLEPLRPDAGSLLRDFEGAIHVDEDADDRTLRQQVVDLNNRVHQAPSHTTGARSERAHLHTRRRCRWRRALRRGKVPRERARQNGTVSTSVGTKMGAFVKTILYGCCGFSCAQLACSFTKSPFLELVAGLVWSGEKSPG